MKKLKLLVCGLLLAASLSFAQPSLPPPLFAKQKSEFIVLRLNASRNDHRIVLREKDLWSPTELSAALQWGPEPGKCYLNGREVWTGKVRNFGVGYVGTRDFAVVDVQGYLPRKASRSKFFVE